MKTDTQYMELALEEAAKAYGLASPNPCVGAVVVKDGAVVGKGHNTFAGLPHAEPNALDEAGEKADGGTLYVTLEPCSTTGRTPPCTERVIRSGVKRVVIGCLDSNPLYCGAGVGILEKAGIEVTSGVLEEKCRKINEDFFWWINKRRPFVTLKMAMTLDGKIATASGDSKWITSEAARAYVQWMRRGSDAIMVGGNTYLTDKPSLTVREPADWWRQPKKILWSSKSASQLECDNNDIEIAKPVTSEEWIGFLKKLGANNVKSMLLEGGGELAGNALKAGIVNKVCFFIAPKILGGRDSRTVVGGENPLRLAEAMNLNDVYYEKIGEDLLISGYCEKCLQD